jgi:hypothetical protein
MSWERSDQRVMGRECVVRCVACAWMRWRVERDREREREREREKKRERR